MACCRPPYLAETRGSLRSFRQPLHKPLRERFFVAEKMGDFSEDAPRRGTLAPSNAGQPVKLERRMACRTFWFVTRSKTTRSGSLFTMSTARCAKLAAQGGRGSCATPKIRTK